MSRIEEFSNRLADLNWTWWPLLSLRPAKDEFITERVVVRTTVVFGPAAAVVTAALVWSNGERRAGALLAFSLPTILIFYLIMRGVTTRYWNRRAARLRQRRSSHSAAAN